MDVLSRRNYRYTSSIKAMFRCGSCMRLTNIWYKCVVSLRAISIVSSYIANNPNTFPTSTVWVTGSRVVVVAAPLDIVSVVAENLSVRFAQGESGRHRNKNKRGGRAPD